MGTTSPDTPRTVSGLAVGYALFGGILAWMAHLIGQAAMTGYACETGQLWPFHVITVVTLLAVAHAGWIGWRIRHDPDDAPSIRAGRFLGFAGLVINAFNAVMIVAEWVPVLFIHPCATG